MNSTYPLVLLDHTLVSFTAATWGVGVSLFTVLQRQWRVVIRNYRVEKSQ